MIEIPVIVPARHNNKALSIKIEEKEDEVKMALIISQRRPKDGSWEDTTFPLDEGHIFTIWDTIGQIIRNEKAATIYKVISDDELLCGDVMSVFSRKIYAKSYQKRVSFMETHIEEEKVDLP